MASRVDLIVLGCSAQNNLNYYILCFVKYYHVIASKQSPTPL